MPGLFSTAAKNTVLHRVFQTPVCFFLGLTGGTVETSHLRIKVSGRNLKKGILHSDDPYYIVSLSEDGGNTKTEIGRSETISNDLNPDWKFEFELTFDRNNNQYLYFHVYDHDIMKIDDTLGRVWLNVADYVDKGEWLIQTWINKGILNIYYLIITTTKEGQAGSGKLPIPPDAAWSPNKDDILLSKRTGDPYVLVDSVDGPRNTILKKVGRTKTVTDSQHPVWNDVITFNWNRNLDQRIRFTIFDEDLIKHDRFDHVWMEVNDYVAKGHNYTLLLPKKGSITITKA
ncbi:E3 ubiquitin-protein ligase NEDD4-like [Orchesella cincta]|uniref:E3 ubiquitin-protein ligase NEDD4-like n=1 Tax=Orchesella cincta TaxID=48709 RepID=A0A1D2MCN6_ORCCI|nr:E3 ubiquitin-protein ligase NEDD4-like [Orchesella cincta]